MWQVLYLATFDWGGGGDAVQSYLPCSVMENDRPDSPRTATLQRRAAFWNLLTGWPLGISSSCLSSDARTQGGSPGDISLFCSPPRDIEIFALFISCMCHDLDHRGTNNSFQVASVRACPPHSGDPLPCLLSLRRDGRETSIWGERREQYPHWEGLTLIQTGGVTRAFMDFSRNLCWLLSTAQRALSWR